MANETKEPAVDLIDAAHRKAMRNMSEMLLYRLQDSHPRIVRQLQLKNNVRLTQEDYR